MRLDWGRDGLDALADCETFAIVDVLSFSTCVTMAVEAGAAVIPWAGPGDEAGAQALAAQHDARVAQRERSANQLSLSPRSMALLRSGDSVLLPSPNGSTLSTLAQGHGRVVVGCLRNASAVAAWLLRARRPIAVIAAGERWPQQNLRVALEDALGAGAICAALQAANADLALSAEAQLAADAFIASPSPADAVRNSVSGRELIQRGFEADLEVALAINQSKVVPVLKGPAFSNSSSQ